VVYQKTIYSTKNVSVTKAVRTSLPQKMPIMKVPENQDGLEMNQLLVQVT